MADDNHTELNQWVEERARLVAPPASWAPDTYTARGRFEARRQQRSGWTRYLLAAAAAMTLGTMVLGVSPTARAFAEYCLRCITSSSIQETSGDLQSGPEGATARRAVQGDRGLELAPDFLLQDSDGNEMRLSDFRGRVALLNFWATWCTPCRIEIPWFTELERIHKNQGFAVLGVSLDTEGWDAVRAFLARADINYRVAIGNDETASQFGVTVLPTTFLIDRTGRIAAVHKGLTSRKALGEEVDRLLRAP